VLSLRKDLEGQVCKRSQVFMQHTCKSHALSWSMHMSFRSRGLECEHCSCQNNRHPIQYACVYILHIPVNQHMHTFKHMFARAHTHKNEPTPISLSLFLPLSLSFSLSLPLSLSLSLSRARSLAHSLTHTHTNAHTNLSLCTKIEMILFKI